MPNTKKYIITAITLGAIASASAGLIGVTNLITRDQIKKNEKKLINKGIAAIFGQNSSILDDFDVEGYTYTNHAYRVQNDEANQQKMALYTTGSNMYGKISLLVGFSETYIPGGTTSEMTFTGLYVIVDEQTYASTLEDNYITPLNGGSRELDDVSCGATYGAKLVREMVTDATGAANSLMENNNG